MVGRKWLTITSRGPNYAPPICGSLRSLYRKLAPLHLAPVVGVSEFPKMCCSWIWNLEKMHRLILFTVLLAGCTSTTVIEETTAATNINSTNTGCTLSAALSHVTKITNGIWLKAYGAKYAELTKSSGFHFMLQENNTLSLTSDELRFIDENSGKISISRIKYFVRPFCGVDKCEKRVDVLSQLIGDNSYGSSIDRLFKTREAANVYAAIFDFPQGIGKNFSVTFPNALANGQNIEIAQITFKTGDRKVNLIGCSY